MADFEIRINALTRRWPIVGILNFGNWNLFGIWFLVLGIFYLQRISCHLYIFLNLIALIGSIHLTKGSLPEKKPQDPVKSQQQKGPVAFADNLQALPVNMETR